MTLDVHLRSADGIQVIQALVQRQCRAAVTIVSATRAADTRGGRRVAHQEACVSGVLEKPDRLQAPGSGGAAPGGGGRRCCRPGSDDAYTADSEELHFRPDAWRFLPTPAAGEPARWLDQGRGVGALAPSAARILLPGAFLHGIEAMGVMRQFTKQILDQAWHGSPAAASRGRRAVRVNISPSELSDPEFVDDTCSCVAADTGIAAPADAGITRIDGGAGPGGGGAGDAPTRLRIHGFVLAIDDIGNAFRSLSRLLQQPLSCGSSTTRWSASWAIRARPEVVAAMSAAGALLGMETVAEGVRI